MGARGRGLSASRGRDLRSLCQPYPVKAYDNLGQREEALKNLNDALAIWRDLDNGQSKMRPMSRMDMLRNLSQLRALRELNDSMPAKWREKGGRAAEAATLDNLGKT